MRTQSAFRRFPAALLLTLLASITGLCRGGAADPGESSYCKSWDNLVTPAKAQTGGKPILIYFVHKSKSVPVDCKFYESDDFFGKEDIKKRLSEFTCVKIIFAMDPDLPKGWSSDIIREGKRARASVILMSNDLSVHTVIRKGSQESGVYDATPKGFETASKVVLNYEANKLAAKEKLEKMKTVVDHTKIDPNKKPEPKEEPKEVKNLAIVGKPGAKDKEKDKVAEEKPKETIKPLVGLDEPVKPKEKKDPKKNNADE